MDQLPKIAIIYLSYHSEPHLVRAIEALKNLQYSKSQLAFIAVDNPHPQHGSSVAFLNQTLLPLQGIIASEVIVLPQKENAGFSGGNNAGMRVAIERGYEYVFLHNQDGYMEPDALNKLVAVLRGDSRIGVAQSLMVFADTPELINSAGNSFHYLGLGFCADLKKTVASFSPITKKINYASGAAVLLRTQLLKQHGLWDEDFFFYHEDLEYSLRLRTLGYEIVLVPGSVFRHAYEFNRNPSKFYFMERNRYGILLMFYKLPTILLIVPMLIVMEAGLIFFSLNNGWYKEKFLAYEYWWKLGSWRRWLKKRRLIQAERRCTDRELTKDCADRIVFDDAAIDNWLLNKVGNPLLAAYWAVVKKLIVW